MAVKANTEWYEKDAVIHLTVSMHTVVHIHIVVHSLVYVLTEVYVGNMTVAESLTCWSISCD